MLGKNKCVHFMTTKTTYDINVEYKAKAINKIKQASD